MIDNIKKINSVYKAAREMWPNGSIRDLGEDREAALLSIYKAA